MVHGPRDVRLDTEPDLTDDPPAGHVRIRTVATAVSTGTEMAAYTAKHGVPFYGWPFESPSAMGYLNVGRVEAVAAAGADPSVTAGANPPMPAVGAAPTVAAGASRAVPAVGDLLYTFRPHRESFDFPLADPWWRVPGRVDPAVAGFTYLISLGAHALRRAGLVAGERVAVVGLGAVGLGAVAIAKQLGSHVTAIDPIAFRRALAVELGADAAVDPASGSVGDVNADVVVEAAGTWPGVSTAYDAARTQGRVAIVALHPEPGPGPFSPLGETFYAKQLSVISTSFQAPEDLPVHHVRFTLRRGCADILDRLAAGSLDFGPAVTHRVPVADLPALYAHLEAGDLEAGAIAVMWEPNA